MHLLADLALDLVRHHVVSRAVFVLDQVVALECHFRVVDGRGELLPMFNLKLLQRFLVEWGLLHGLPFSVIDCGVLTVVGARCFFALVLLLNVIASPRKCRRTSIFSVPTVWEEVEGQQVVAGQSIACILMGHMTICAE